MAGPTDRGLHHAGRPICCIVEARAHVLLCLRVHGIHAERRALLHLQMVLSLEMRGPGQVLLMLLALVHVAERLLAAVAAARVPVVALVATVQGCGPHRRVRTALPILLVLQRGALRLRNVGAQLRDNVPLIHAGLLLLNVPLVLLNHDRRRLDVARARRDLRRRLHVVSH